VVDHQVVGLLALQRREKRRVVQAGLGLIPAGEVVPELDGQVEVVTGEVVEQEQARTALVHVSYPAHVAGGDVMHAACLVAEGVRQRLVGGVGADLAGGVG
jgi:hypothetical protein